LLDDAGSQVAMFSRVHDIGATTEDRYGFSTGIKRAFVGGAVHAKGQATDDRPSSRRQIRAKLACHHQPVGDRLEPTMATASRVGDPLPTDKGRVNDLRKRPESTRGDQLESPGGRRLESDHRPPPRDREAIGLVHVGRSETKRQRRQVQAFLLADPARRCVRAGPQCRQRHGIDVF
jgi:hypothetical protein